MKKSIISACTLAIMFFLVTDAFSVNSRKQYFLKPQLGLWFGPLTPILDTGDHVDTDLGGGAFFRYNLPYDPLKIGFDTSYQKYDSKGTTSLRLIPAYMDLVYLLPFDLPVKIQLKAGGGFCHVYMEPDKVAQWDPMFMAGTEVSFPAGKLANIALRIDYLCIYEKYLPDATENGYVINAGISLYFNLNL